MADVGIRSTTKPAANASWLTWGNSIDATVRALAEGGFHLDEFDDATDDAKLTSAIAAQQAATDRNMPAIVLPSRPMNFTTPRTIYSGLKIVPSRPNGQKNPEIAGGQYSGPEVTLGGSITSGASSWWNSPGADTNDVFFCGFQVQGSQGSSTHQFLDYAGGGSMYPCAFYNLSFNFMRGAIGRSDRKALMTQADFMGTWTMNNAWDCQINFGGSDIRVDWLNNIGVSQSAAQTGTLTRYFWKINTTEVDIIGKTYISAMNGWRGVLIDGNSSVNIYAGVLEGYKPTRINGLLAGPAPGSLLKIDGGSVNLFGTKIGQGMDNPDASEDGLVQVNGGEVGMFGVQFYGQNMASVNAVDHNGGRLSMYGITKRTAEAGTWINRPRVSSQAPALTTLAASASAGATSVSVTGAVSVGSVIMIGDSESRTVTGVTGSGPYSASFSGGLASSYASGAPVVPNQGYWFESDRSVARV